MFHLPEDFPDVKLTITLIFISLPSPQAFAHIIGFLLTAIVALEIFQ